MVILVLFNTLTNDDIAQDKKLILHLRIYILFSAEDSELELSPMWEIKSLVTSDFGFVKISETKDEAKIKELRERSLKLCEKYPLY